MPRCRVTWQTDVLQPPADMLMAAALSLLTQASRGNKSRAQQGLSLAVDWATNAKGVCHLSAPSLQSLTLMAWHCSC